MAEHLGRATDSQVRHRESNFARAVEDSNLLPKCATRAAFSQDNCDSEPRVGVAQGEGPHIPCVACVALWGDAEVGMLDDASMLKQVRDLSLEDVLAGSDAAEGERRYGAFFDALLRAVSKFERIRSTEGGALWCFEAQLREVRFEVHRSTCGSHGLVSFFPAGSFPFQDQSRHSGVVPNVRSHLYVDWDKTTIPETSAVGGS